MVMSRIALSSSRLVCAGHARLLAGALLNRINQPAIVQPLCALKNPQHGARFRIMNPKRLRIPTVPGKEIIADATTDLILLRFFRINVNFA